MEERMKTKTEISAEIARATKAYQTKGGKIQRFKQVFHTRDCQGFRGMGEEPDRALRDKGNGVVSSRTPEREWKRGRVMQNVAGGLDFQWSPRILEEGRLVKRGTRPVEHKAPDLFGALQEQVTEFLAAR